MGLFFSVGMKIFLSFRMDEPPRTVFFFDKIKLKNLAMGKNDGNGRRRKGLA
jgi:hypothetical protein